MPSKIHFSGFNNNYDEEQAFNKHLEYLRAKGRTSKELQTTNMNEYLGIAPVMQVPKTAAELLNDNVEVNRQVQNYLSQIFVDNPNIKINYTTETEEQTNRHRYPSRHAYDLMTQDDKKIFLTHYPAIMVDLKKIPLLTPEYFSRYIRKYGENIENSGGVSNYNNTPNIPNLDELRGLIENLPQQESINTLNYNVGKLKQIIKTSQEIAESEREDLLEQIKIIRHVVSMIQENTPTQDDIEKLEVYLSQRIETSNEGATNTILEKMETLPTEDTLILLNNIINTQIHDNAASKGDIQMLLDKIEENIGGNNNEQFGEFMNKVDSDLVSIGNILKTQEDRSAVIDTRLKENVVAEIVANLKQTIVTEKNGEINAINAERAQNNQAPLKPFSIQMLTALEKNEILKQAQLLANQYILQQEEEHKFEPFEQKEVPAIFTPSDYQEAPTSMGKGIISNRIKNKVHPKYSLIRGRGISIKEEPKFIELGNFVISIPHYNNSILKLKYIKTGQDVPNLTTRMNEDFNEFIESFLDTQKINTKMLNKLNSEDKQFFKKLITKSGLSVKYKSKELSSKEEDQENERFNLVKSEFIAGNDNKQLIKELKSFLLKFMNDGRISKKEGNELLYHLSL